MRTTLYSFILTVGYRDDDCTGNTCADYNNAVCIDAGGIGVASNSADNTDVDNIVVDNRVLMLACSLRSELASKGSKKAGILYC